MKTSTAIAAKRAKGKAPVCRARSICILRLFVAGATARSRQAIMHVRELCGKMPTGSYELEVIDIHQLPGLARDHQIVATPTLIKMSPKPEQRFIGSMANVTALCFDNT